jgi:hypothetical protein
MQILLVGAGGFIGSALRFTVSGLVHRAIPFSGFPYGTLVVNLVGCLAIGLLAGLAESRQVIGPELLDFRLRGSRVVSRWRVRQGACECDGSCPAGVHGGLVRARHHECSMRSI